MNLELNRLANGAFMVRTALEFQAYVCQRSSEIVGATWEEFDFLSKSVTWTIPRSRMKMTNRDYDQVLILPKACQ